MAHKMLCRPGDKTFESAVQDFANAATYYKTGTVLAGGTRPELAKAFQTRFISLFQRARDVALEMTSVRAAATARRPRPDTDMSSLIRPLSSCRSHSIPQVTVENHDDSMARHPRCAAAAILQSASRSPQGR